jgi:hypothetical protein
MTPSVALYPRPESFRGEQCAKAPPDGGVSPTTVWSMTVAGLGRAVSRAAVPAADCPTRRRPAELPDAVPVGGRGGGRVGQVSVLPSAAGPVHLEGPPGGFLFRSGTGLSGCPVTWLRRPSSRPVPPVGRPTVWCRPVGLAAQVPSRVSSVWPWSTPARRSLHGRRGSGCVWPAACPSGSRNGRGSLATGDAVGSGGSTGRGGRRSRVWVGVALGLRWRSRSAADRPGGQPGWVAGCDGGPG